MEVMIMIEDVIIGIDFIRSESDGGVYGFYESKDGGYEWIKLIESKKIYDLLKFAKDEFSECTPLVMPAQIQELLRYEILSEREIKKLFEENIKHKQTWFSRVIQFFKGNQNHEKNRKRSK
jgi:hypothetical protein